jgi:DNA invertase Pin-like site-specific DNA recombinase
MSTDHQEYSLDNQADVIRKYADLQGFEIIKTYTDNAKSGLVLKHRRGLAQLLSDVVGGPQPYRVILVYDISRWGRFQDADESAYYEFLCKSSGLPIHYCAEQFVNDGAMPNVVMKALKRAMAAEYSRRAIRQSLCWRETYLPTGILGRLNTRLRTASHARFIGWLSQTNYGVP